MPEATIQKKRTAKSPPGEAVQEVVVKLPLSELHPFPDHPFQVKKIPKVKELSQEFSTLLAQKKQDYAELQKAREEARRLQIYRANAALLLRTDEPEQEKSREHQQEK